MLGGLLLQHYAARRPRRVLSLALTNSFVETGALPLGGALALSLLPLAPLVLLQKQLLDGLVAPGGDEDAEMAPAQAEAIDFVVEQVTRTHRREASCGVWVSDAPLLATAPSVVPQSFGGGSVAILSRPNDAAPSAVSAPRFCSCVMPPRWSTAAPRRRRGGGAAAHTQPHQPRQVEAAI